MTSFQASNTGARIDTPAGVPLSAITHLGIGAHSDDLEIMAYHGIAKCYENDNNWFGGVTVTNGVGSPQDPGQVLATEDLRITRQHEQLAAAELGNYAFIAQLDYPSAAAKSVDQSLVSELTEILKITNPDTVYLHQPADKHPTHLGVLKASIAALRNLPENQRPKKVYGCEVWRDLDWLPDDQKVYLDTSAHPDLARDIIAVFKSQIASGTDYVNGTLGRRLSNGTFADPHIVRSGHSFTLAIDLNTCLSEDLSLKDFIYTHLTAFQKSVMNAF